MHLPITYIGYQLLYIMRAYPQKLYSKNANTFYSFNIIYYYIILIIKGHCWLIIQKESVINYIMNIT